MVALKTEEETAMRTRLQKLSRRKKARFWADHVATWAEGSLSQAEYCRRHGLAVSTFRYWRSKLGERRPQRSPGSSPTTVNPATIVPVPMRGPSGGLLSGQQAPARASLQVQVGGGYRIEVHGDFAAPVFCKLVRALERLG